ncbi:MAG: hypothetical protein PVG99_03240 [Desulfobacteraceae bacterium]|jgi:hypothetical protein
MARAEAKLLDSNDRFPEMALQLIDRATLRLPDGFGKGYGVLLLYRGYW